MSRKCLAGLMKAAGLQGASRRKASRTTVRCPEGCPAPDLVERDFAVSGADRLRVAKLPASLPGQVSPSIGPSGWLDPQGRRLGAGHAPRVPASCLAFCN